MTARGRFLPRAAAIVAVAGLAVLGLAGPASAHVSVSPSEATQGGYAALTFRVPNERDDASTKALAIQLPTDTPLASVSVKPIAGWTITTKKVKLPKPIKTDDGEVTEAIGEVDYVATTPAAQIAPGQFQEFELSVGPLPETDSVTFKAVQTYSNGEIVRWIQETTEGAAEPEYPAPKLTLVKGDGDGDHHDADTSTSPAASASDDDSDGGNGVAIGLGVAGLIAGLLGLGAGLFALRKASTPPPTA